MSYTGLFDLVILIFRLYCAYFFIQSGWDKVVGGQEKWLWLGQQMGNLGIHFTPILWGLAATFSEIFGSFALLFGFCTRIASLLLACTMLVALVMHVENNDPWTVYSIPLAFMCGFIVLIIYGAGSYSVDYWLWKK